MTGEEVSYAKLQTMVVKATSALVGMGFGRGSVATVYSSNCIEFFALYLAVGAAGGTISTVNPSYTAGSAFDCCLITQHGLLCRQVYGKFG